MGLIVITGGARSGKSAVASRLAERCTDDVTLVVFADSHGDPEMAERIRRHQESRPSEWRVLEARNSMEWIDQISNDVVVLDCLGTLLGRVMSETLKDLGGGQLADADEVPHGFEAQVERRFAPIVGWLVRRVDHTIVVTNEVGDGVIPPYATGRVFRDVLGRANRSLIERADRSYLAVAGRLVELTNLPTKATWPWHEKGCD
jgi:adenosylcobinamide kinase/adenosylcobinamide-phosphate guanylyltransferase